MDEQIEQTWKTSLQTEFSKEYWQALSLDIQASYLINEPPIYPPKPAVFRAFELCPLNQVKVVILGQDPYHGPNQATGLAFSVPNGTPVPPSLKNIYNEIASDLGTPVAHTGNLERWAEQGVLLMNATLTVESGHAGSHQGKGWETFTDEVIRVISREREHVVFLLWGNFAQSKAQLIDESKHLVLKTTHPSPLSAHRGFLGCKHFSQTNEYLKIHSITEIEWQ